MYKQDQAMQITVPETSFELLPENREEHYTIKGEKSHNFSPILTSTSH